LSGFFGNAHKAGAGAAAFVVGCLVEETETHVLVGLLLLWKTVSDLEANKVGGRRYIPSSFFSSSLGASAAAPPAAAPPAATAPPAPPDGTEASLEEPSAMSCVTLC
jgi:hypothetical protein